MTAPCPPPREPSPPKIALPPGACDTHAHVFGPASRFPYTPDRSYTPPDAPLEKYLSMLDTLGFTHARWCKGARMAATTARCSTRSHAVRSACAASR